MIARTIWEQMGGHKFAIMTGAKNFVDTGNGLAFRIGQNCKRINAVEITLNGLDLYDLKFSRVRKNVGAVIAKYTNIYAEDLQNLFTLETGMATRL